MTVALQPRPLFVADELALFRRGVQATLRDLTTAIAGEAQSVRELRDTLMNGDELVVVGTFVDASTVAAVRAVKDAADPPLVLAMVTSSAEGDVPDLLAAGADGVIRRSASPTELFDAAAAVCDGGRHVAVSLTTELRGAVTPVIDLREGTGDAAELSGREREMLVYLAQGHSNREIAEALCISLATVKSHLIRLYAKLGVNSRSEALGAAVGRGLLR